MSAGPRCVCGWSPPLSLSGAAPQRCLACDRRLQSTGAKVHDSSMWAALMLAGLGVLTGAPAIWVIGDAMTRSAEEIERAGNAGVPAWTYLSMLAAVLLLAFSTYVAQLPHWTSLRVAALVTLLLAAVEAMLFGGTLLGGTTAWASRLLQIAVPDPGASGPQLNNVASWCLVLLASSTAASVWLAWRAYEAKREFAVSDVRPQAADSGSETPPLQSRS